jgi:large subunit ribosomal protein L17
MFMNMSNSLFLHEQIKTTLPKAKDLRSIVEKYITMAKNSSNSLHTRRVLLSRLNNNQEAVSKLLTTFSDRYRSRPGGYTRIVKAGFRYGDSAPMAVIELVDRPAMNAEAADESRVIDQEKNILQEKKVSEKKKQVSKKDKA